MMDVIGVLYYSMAVQWTAGLLLVFLFLVPALILLRKTICWRRHPVSHKKPNAVFDACRKRLHSWHETMTTSIAHRP